MKSVGFILWERSLSESNVMKIHSIAMKILHQKLVLKEKSGDHRSEYDSSSHYHHNHDISILNKMLPVKFPSFNWTFYFIILRLWLWISMYCSCMNIIYGLNAPFWTQDTPCHDYGVISPLVNYSCQSLSSRRHSAGSWAGRSTETLRMTIMILWSAPAVF